LLTADGSPIRGGVLADDCGLGKSVTALAAIDRDSERRTIHRPALILCPAALIDTWFTEIQTHFKARFTVHLFHGQTAHTGDLAYKQAIINNRSQLIDTLGRL
ncbi:uncharacterized protein BO87DRAFT_278632, partial [Aspergillus neoniger CBS 115656]